MTTYKSQPEMAIGTGPPSDADAGGDLQRRAVRLCVCAEPHADAVPCDLHVRQALSQLSLIERGHDETATSMDVDPTPGPGRL